MPSPSFPPRPIQPPTISLAIRRRPIPSRDRKGAVPANFTQSPDIQTLTSPPPAPRRHTESPPKHPPASKAIVCSHAEPIVSAPAYPTADDLTRHSTTTDSEP